MGDVKTTVREEARRLVIECPARCAERGCDKHAGLSEHDWRESREFPPDTSIDYARMHLEDHERRFPKSGPYRLVEYVRTVTETMEVL